ncbi:MAG: competence/damage-inducible protein A [Ponticaulis sp.]|nr:competence/damage-inducible protein A [Ponticaulis sp.]
MSNSKNAAVLLIGDELLSGRTRDINLQNIARYLGPLGIQVKESRTISDDRDAIISTVNDLRGRYDYVFTTGGIGPTHDDITADCVAAAFEANIDEREDALAILTEHYNRTGIEFTDARKRMARIPDGASLIKNPVSSAPGFQIGNVFVMAGVPSIVQGMLEDVGHRLEGGQVVLSSGYRIAGAKEGEMAQPLGQIAKAHLNVSIGSYPWYDGPHNTGVNIVVRGADRSKIDAALADITDMLDGMSLGFEPVSTL